MPKELACSGDPEIVGATCRLTLPFDAETAEKQVAEEHKIPTRCGIGFMPGAPTNQAARHSHQGCSHRTFRGSVEYCE
jgi:hypothetical protein